MTSLPCFGWQPCTATCPPPPPPLSFYLGYDSICECYLLLGLG
jgi:hypothetical protein